MTDAHHDAAPIVLVFDYETLVRLVANNILSDAGYRVLGARDGRHQNDLPNPGKGRRAAALPVPATLGETLLARTHSTTRPERSPFKSHCRSRHARSARPQLP